MIKFACRCKRFKEWISNHWIQVYHCFLDWFSEGTKSAHTRSRDMSYVRRTAFFQLLLFQATWKVSLGKLLILMDQTRERVCYLISKHREIKKTSKNQEKKQQPFGRLLYFLTKIPDSGIKLMWTLDNDSRNRDMKFYVNSALSCSKSSSLEFQALKLFARLLQLKRKWWIDTMTFIYKAIAKPWWEVMYWYQEKKFQTNFFSQELFYFCKTTSTGRPKVSRY